METDGKEKVRRNLPKLVETTICSTVLLAFFTSENILGKSEDEKIKAEQRNNGDQSAAAKFYDLILTRKGSFDVLLHALKATKQSGALNLLKTENGTRKKSTKVVPSKFVKAPEYMDEFVKQKDKHILIVITQNCEITSQWIMEQTPNCKLINKNIVGELEIQIKDEIAVVNVEENFDRLLLIAKNYNKKVVLVTSIQFDDERYTFLKPSSKQYQFVQENLQWKNLALSEKDKIIAGLKSSLHIYGLYLTDTLEDIDTKMLQNLILGRFPSPRELFSDTIPDPITYYIPRTLVTRNVISKTIFQKSYHATQIEDLFLFSNIERPALSLFAKEGLTDTSGNLLQTRKVESKYVIMEHDNHFHDIRKYFSTINVHHIKYDGENFIWIKSHGNISPIQKNISYQQSNIHETNFLREITNQQHKLPVCISDTPGMGKSVILQHLATELSNMHKIGIVAFAVISDLIACIKNKPDNMSLSVATTSAIFDHISISKLGHAYLQVNTTFIQELFLDGLDEIDPDQMDFALDFIKEIIKTFSETRLWITTRPHVLHSLENKLSVLGYNIAPFRYEDQINFLTSFWSSRLSGNPESEILTNLAKDCLTSLKSSLNLGEGTKEDYQQPFMEPFSSSNIPASKDALVDDIAGIPLQCLLLGEIYEEQVSLVVQGALKEITITQYDIRSIPDLFSKMIEKKLTNFKKRYDKSNLDRSEIENAHMQVSIQQLYPAVLNEYSDCLSHSLSMQQILDVGIIEAQNVLSTPRFIHRTFAEYFFTYFIVHVLLKSKNQNSIELLSANIFKTTNFDFKIQEFEFTSIKFEQIVIVRFLNAFMDHLDASQYQLLNYFGDSEDVCKVLDASLYHNFENIFNCFLHYAKNRNQFNEYYFSNDTLLQAVHWASVPLLKIVTEKYASVKATPIDEIKILTYVYGYEQYFSRITLCDSFDYYYESENESFSDEEKSNTNVEEVDIDTMANQSTEPSLTLLHVAIHRGDFATLEFLLTNYFLDSVRENIVGKYDKILHICVEDSISNNDKKLAEKSQIINMLGVTNTSLLIMLNDKDQYPIERKGVHIKLLHELWKTAGVLYKKNADLRRILFKLVDRLKEDFLCFIKIIIADIEPMSFDAICTGQYWYCSFLNQVIISDADDIDLLNYLKSCSDSFCLANDNVSSFQKVVDKNHKLCADWLIRNVEFTVDEIRDLLRYSIKKESHSCVDVILEYLKKTLFTKGYNFYEVFVYIFNDNSDLFGIKNTKLVLKLLKYFVIKKFLEKPISKEHTLHIGNESYYFIDSNPVDLENSIKYGCLLLGELEVRKHINSLQSYFFKCMWISDKIKFPKEKLVDKCKNYLGFPDFQSRQNGSTLFQVAAKYFGDDKISETFLSIIATHNIHLKEDLFFSLVDYISIYKKLDFWKIITEVCGRDLGIDRHIQHSIPPFLLSSNEILDIGVIGVFNSQLESLQQGKPTILNIQRLVYIVIKNHDLKLIQNVCLWCINRCPSKKLSLPDIKVFFNGSAYTLLDAAIESLNGDVLQYLYYSFKCKISLLAKTKILSYIHSCLSSLEFEVTTKIKYVKILSLVFPNDMTNFVNQPNDDGLVPLSLPSLEQELISVLVDLGANVNFQDENKNTSLHHAVFNTLIDLSVATELVKCGAYVNAKNLNNQTPLLALVQHQNICIFPDIEFIMMNEFNLAEIYNDGNTIVHFLALKTFDDLEFQNLVQCLISKNYLHLLQKKNRFKKTPLDLVEENINFSQGTRNILKLNMIKM